MGLPIELMLSYWSNLSIQEKQKIIKLLMKSLSETDKKMIIETVMKEAKK